MLRGVPKGIIRNWISSLPLQTLSEWNSLVMPSGFYFDKCGKLRYWRNNNSVPVFIERFHFIHISFPCLKHNVWETRLYLILNKTQNDEL
jgi:hypothetical protein